MRFAFAPEPEGDLAPYVSWHQAWSERLLEGVLRLYPDGGPDVIEVADYQGEGFAMAHARAARTPGSAARCSRCASTPVPRSVPSSITVRTA